MFNMLEPAKQRTIADELDKTPNEVRITSGLVIERGGGTELVIAGEMVLSLTKHLMRYGLPSELVMGREGY